MAEILDKTFLDLNGLKTYDGKLKKHFDGTASSTGSELVKVGLTLDGDHTSTQKYISGLTVDTNALATALNGKATKNIGTITVKNGSSKVADVVVDSLNDTITLAGGTNVTLAADAGTDTITINANMNFSSLDSTVSDDGTYVDIDITETDGKLTSVDIDDTKLVNTINGLPKKNIGTITVKNGSSKVADVVVDSLNDTITLAGGTNVTLAADAGTDTITINANMNFSSLDSTVSDDGTYVDIDITETDGKLTSVDIDETKLGNTITQITSAIESINNTLVGGVNFIGVVTAIPTTSSVTIDGKPVTAKTGDIVLYKYTGGEDSANPNSAQDTGLEFIYTGTAWEELGSPDKCSKLIDAVETTVSGLSTKVTSLETNQVLAVKQTTNSDSCGTDLASGKLSATIDTAISNSTVERGYILPVLRDLDKKAFVHIKAIPDAQINALFA